MPLDLLDFSRLGSSLRRVAVGALASACIALGTGAGFAGANVTSTPSNSKGAGVHVTLANAQSRVGSQSRAKSPSLKTVFHMGATDGGVFSFPSTQFYGSMGGKHLNAPIVGIAGDSDGYWLAAKDGGIFCFGSLSFFGSLPKSGISVDNIVGISPTATYGGYYLVSSTGMVYAFGDATTHGSLPSRGVHVNDIVGIAAAPGDSGYWLVGSDGGVFSFPTTLYEGSVPAWGLKISNIKGIAATSSGLGYWLVGADGGIFNFGDAGFYGSLPGRGIRVSNVVGILGTSDSGYWLAGADGGDFAFGSANFFGSLPADRVSVHDVVGLIKGEIVSTTPSTTSSTTPTCTPSLSSVTPSTGPINGATSVTLHGSCLTAVTKVGFGTQSTLLATAHSVVPAKNHITLKTPAHSAGTETVWLYVNHAWLNTHATFTFYRPTCTVFVTTVTPTSGSTTGGDSIKLLGSCLGTVTAVGFGTTQLNLTLASNVKATTLRVKLTTPRHSPGIYEIWIETNSTWIATTLSYTFVCGDPYVTSITPTQGPTSGSTTVTVTGYCFDTVTKAAFGDTVATLITATTVVVTLTTTITFKTPPHHHGLFTLWLKSGGTWHDSTVAYNFEYLCTPTVTNASPTSGKTTGGTKVTVTGQCLGKIKKVGFGSITPSTWGTIQPTGTTTLIVVKTPVHSAGPVKIYYETTTGTWKDSGLDFTFFLPTCSPTVASITPSAGKTTGNTAVTLTGSCLTGIGAVGFGTTATHLSLGTTVVAATTTVTLHTPAHAPGSTTVWVETGATWINTTLTYIFNCGNPHVLSITPTSGSATGGTAVSVTGYCFTSVTKVGFGPSAGTIGGETSVVVTSTTKITFTTPAHSSGTFRMWLKKGVTWFNSEQTFTFTTTSAGGTTPPATTTCSPSFVTMTPTHGVTTGGNFSELRGTCLTNISSVGFGPTPTNLDLATTISSQTVAVTFTTPKHAPGKEKVWAKTGTTWINTTLTFTFECGKPHVTSITPGSGTTSGGSTITLSGFCFSTVTKVGFGPTATTLSGEVTVTVSTTGAKLTITTPPHSHGTFKVWFTEKGKWKSSGKTFEFLFDCTPFVKSLSTSTGPTGGGTIVTMTGTCLSKVKGVRFGTTPTAPAGTITTKSTTTLVVTTPAHSAGTVQIEIQTSTTTIWRFATKTFTFTTTSGGGTTPPNPTTPPSPTTCSPTITSISRTHGAVTGGTKVSFRGTCLTKILHVSFGSTTSPTWGSALSASTTTLQVVTPKHTAGGPGKATIWFTVTGTWTKLTLSTKFTFTCVPIVNSITAPTGQFTRPESRSVYGECLGSVQKIGFGSKSSATWGIITPTNTFAFIVQTPIHAWGLFTIWIEFTTTWSNTGVSYTF